MKSINLTIDNHLSAPPYPYIDRLARKLICRQLEKIVEGEVILQERGRVQTFGKRGRVLPVSITVEVTDSSMWREIALGGANGAGEAYIQGSWCCSNLPGLVRILLHNNEVLASMDHQLSRLGRSFQKLMHALNRNSRSGSRKNIASHYDLGNDFFGLFLDKTLMYSSGFYQTPDSTLEEASIAKLDRICRKLNLAPGDRVLEIGTGWGGFAIHTAQNYGCHVTSTTLSYEQYQMAQKRVSEAGLEDRVTLLLKDYRDLEGRFDKLVSIEMIEAVGHQYLDTYFRQCSALLTHDGQMLLQAITIRDQDYSRALRNVDFIKKYIFPGGFLPSVSAMTTSISGASDMKISHLEDIGPHYARTLSDWRQRFLARIKEVEDLGYPAEFIRMWEYYLGYCEGGFLAHRLGTVQLLLCKPESAVPAFSQQLEIVDAPQ
jgi:cyclopropane-fatty-acyl-phospholipid synthase